MNFKAWLFFGDSGFETDLHRIETNYASTSIEFPGAEPNDVQERCKQLFNILMGILRGKLLRLMRQTSEVQLCMATQPCVGHCPLHHAAPVDLVPDVPLLSWLLHCAWPHVTTPDAVAQHVSPFQPHAA